MKVLNFPENFEKLHHAYIVSSSSAVEIWEEIESNLDFKKTANPDALYMSFESFGIDDARFLSDWAIKKPFGENKVAVLSFIAFTHEAQNALLKLFEEPPANTYFFIVLENRGVLLPTLLSRVQILDNTMESGVGSTSKKFFSSNLPERMKLIAKIVKDKDREGAKALVAGLLEQTRGNKKISAGDLGTLLKYERYLADRRR